jgi:hypothetical protein
VPAEVKPGKCVLQILLVARTAGVDVLDACEIVTRTGSLAGLNSIGSSEVIQGCSSHVKEA